MPDPMHARLPTHVVPSPTFTCFGRRTRNPRSREHAAVRGGYCERRLPLEAPWHAVRRYGVISALSAALMIGGLAGCKAKESEPNAIGGTPATGTPSPVPDTSLSDTTQGVSEMSPLEHLLAAYASIDSPAWSAFDDVQGVTWTDATRVENPDAKPENRYSRGGKLVLAGFGETELPNGKTGPEADYVPGNEGDSGVTLNGTEEQVTSIAVMKFYPDKDFARTLRAQLHDGASLQSIAGQCAFAEGSTTEEPNSTANTFFKLSLSDGSSIFAEATADEEGGKYTPGSTTYFFYRSEPTERIESMQCTRN